MEDNTKQEAEKVVDALSGFATFAANMLNSVVKDAPPEEREKLAKEVDKLRKDGLGSINAEIKKAQDLLNNIPE